VQLDDTLSLVVPVSWGVNTCTTFGGTAFLKFWKEKHSKIGAIYDNFRIYPQIFLERIKLSTSGKRLYQA